MFIFATLNKIKTNMVTKDISKEITNGSTIKIISDKENIYTNRTIEVKDLLDDFLDTCDDETHDFIVNSQTSTALKFVADAWGLEYEVIKI